MAALDGKRVDGGPAFPSVLYKHEPTENWASDGMTLRDWFAGQAMHALQRRGFEMFERDDIVLEDESIAREAYGLADAMLEERVSVSANPLQAELDAAKAQIEHLESLRPHWAQGFTSDGIAAQVTTTAIQQLWALLGAPHQTAAVGRLKELLALEAARP